MTELEKLKLERKALNKRIKELETSGVVIVGDTCVGKEHYPTLKPDRWYIGYYAAYYDKPDKKQWRSLISNADRQKCIDELPHIIEDFQKLYEAVKEQDKC